MLQDLDTTIKKLEGKDFTQTDDITVERLFYIIKNYASEIARDFFQDNWRTQFEAGLSTGYLLSLMGETALAIDSFNKSLQIRTEYFQRNNLGEIESSYLEFVVDSLEEFDADPTLISEYRKEWGRLKIKPEDTWRQIKKVEAELENTEKGMLANHSAGQRKLGLLYQKLGKHEEAISHFQQSIDLNYWDRRQRYENTIANTFSIVDSYLAINNNSLASVKFLRLIDEMFTEEFDLQFAIPSTLLIEFPKFIPYFKKLGLDENLDQLITYGREGFDRFVKELKIYMPIDYGSEGHRRIEQDQNDWKTSQIHYLSKMIGSYHLSEGEYQEASDIYDIGRQFLIFKRHLPKREQAEFAIRAGNRNKAMQLIREDEKAVNLELYKKHSELINLYLQLEDLPTALKWLDRYCQEYKQKLVSGGYSGVFEARRKQIALFKLVLGEDYFHKVRSYADGKDWFSNGGLAFLPEKVVEK